MKKDKNKKIIEVQPPKNCTEAQRIILKYRQQTQEQLEVIKAKILDIQSKYKIRNPIKISYSQISRAIIWCVQNKINPYSPQQKISKHRINKHKEQQIQKRMEEKQLIQNNLLNYLIREEEPPITHEKAKEDIIELLIKSLSNWSILLPTQSQFKKQEQKRWIFQIGVNFDYDLKIDYTIILSLLKMFSHHYFPISGKKILKHIPSVTYMKELQKRPSRVIRTFNCCIDTKMWLVFSWIGIVRGSQFPCLYIQNIMNLQLDVIEKHLDQFFLDEKFDIKPGQYRFLKFQKEKIAKYSLMEYEKIQIFDWHQSQHLVFLSDQLCLRRIFLPLPQFCKKEQNQHKQQVFTNFSVEKSQTFLPFQYSRQMYEQVQQFKNFNFKLSYQQYNLLQSNENAIAIGRSGTGKTTCALLRLFYLQRFNVNDQKNIFLTTNQGLLNQIKIKFRQLKYGFNQADLQYHFSTNEKYKYLKYQQFIQRLNRYEKGSKQTKLNRTFLNLGSDKQFEIDENGNHQRPYFISTIQFIQAIDSITQNPFFISGQQIQSSEYKQVFFLPDQISWQFPVLKKKKINKNNLIRKGLQKQQIKKNQRGKDNWKKQLIYEIFEEQFWIKYIKRQCIIYVENLSPDIVWSQIFSTIKGSIRSHSFINHHLDLSAYLDQSKNSILNEQEKTKAYQIFQQYEVWKQKYNYYDLTDLVNNVISQLGKKKNLNEIQLYSLFVDQVQDLPPSFIFLVAKLISRNIFFGGDTAQTIAKGVNFKFKDIQNLFESNYFQNNVKLDKPKRFQLHENFRSQKKIIQFSNLFIKLLYSIFPDTLDRLPYQYSSKDGIQPLIVNRSSYKLVVDFLKNKYSFLEGYFQQNVFGADVAIIVRDETDVQKLPVQFKNIITKTYRQCKGLQYQIVIVWGIFDVIKDLINKEQSKIYSKKNSKAQINVYQFLRNIKLDENGEIVFEKQKFKKQIKQNYKLCSELKLLYTVCTRARKFLIILDDFVPQALNQIWKELYLVTYIKTQFQMNRIINRSKNLTQLKVSNNISIGQTQQNQILQISKNKQESNWIEQGFTDFFQRKDYGNACKAFRNVKLDKISNLIHGFYQAELGKKQKNPKRFKQAAEIFQKHDQLLKAGICYFQAQQYKKAGKIFLKLDIKKYMAECLLKLRKYEEAQKFYYQQLLFDKCVITINESCYQAFFFKKFFQYSLVNITQKLYNRDFLKICFKNQTNSLIKRYAKITEWSMKYKQKLAKQNKNNALLFKETAWIKPLIYYSLQRSQLKDHFQNLFRSMKQFEKRYSQNSTIKSQTNEQILFKVRQSGELFNAFHRYKEQSSLNQLYCFQNFLKLINILRLQQKSYSGFYSFLKQVNWQKTRYYQYFYEDKIVQPLKQYIDDQNRRKGNKNGTKYKPQYDTYKFSKQLLFQLLWIVQQVKQDDSLLYLFKMLNFKQIFQAFLIQKSLIKNLTFNQRSYPNILNANAKTKQKLSLLETILLFKSGKIQHFTKQVGFIISILHTDLIPENKQFLKQTKLGKNPTSHCIYQLKNIQKEGHPNMCLYQSLQKIINSYNVWSIFCSLDSLSPISFFYLQNYHPKNCIPTPLRQKTIVQKIKQAQQKQCQALQKKLQLTKTNDQKCHQKAMIKLQCQQKQNFKIINDYLKKNRQILIYVSVRQSQNSCNEINIKSNALTSLKQNKLKQLSIFEQPLKKIDLIKSKYVKIKCSAQQMNKLIKYLKSYKQRLDKLQDQLKSIKQRNQRISFKLMEMLGISKYSEQDQKQSQIKRLRELVSNIKTSFQKSISQLKQYTQDQNKRQDKLDFEINQCCEKIILYYQHEQYTLLNIQLEKVPRLINTSLLSLQSHRRLQQQKIRRLFQRQTSQINKKYQQLKGKLIELADYLKVTESKISTIKRSYANQTNKIKDQIKKIEEQIELKKNEIKKRVRNKYESMYLAQDIETKRSGLIQEILSNKELMNNKKIKQLEPALKIISNLSRISQLSGNHRQNNLISNLSILFDQSKNAFIQTKTLAVSFLFTFILLNNQRHRNKITLIQKILEQLKQFEKTNKDLAKKVKQFFLKAFQQWCNMIINDQCQNSGDLLSQSQEKKKIKKQPVEKTSKTSILLESIFFCLQINQFSNIDKSFASMKNLTFVPQILNKSIDRVSNLEQKIIQILKREAQSRQIIEYNTIQKIKRSSRTVDSNSLKKVLKQLILRKATIIKEKLKYEKLQIGKNKQSKIQIEKQIKTKFEKQKQGKKEDDLINQKISEQEHERIFKQTLNQIQKRQKTIQILLIGYQYLKLELSYQIQKSLIRNSTTQYKYARWTIQENSFTYLWSNRFYQFSEKKLYEIGSEIEQNIADSKFQLQRVKDNAYNSSNNKKIKYSIDQQAFKYQICTYIKLQNIFYLTRLIILKIISRLSQAFNDNYQFKNNQFRNNQISKIINLLIEQIQEINKIQQLIEFYLGLNTQYLKHKSQNTSQQIIQAYEKMLELQKNISTHTFNYIGKYFKLSVKREEQNYYYQCDNYNDKQRNRSHKYKSNQTQNIKSIKYVAKQDQTNPLINNNETNQSISTNKQISTQNKSQKYNVYNKQHKIISYQQKKQMQKLQQIQKQKQYFQQQESQKSSYYDYEEKQQYQVMNQQEDDFIKQKKFQQQQIKNHHKYQVYEKKYKK